MKRYWMIAISSAIAAAVIAVNTGSKQREDIMILRKKSLEMEQMRQVAQNRSEK